MSTKPDVAFAISESSRFLEKPCMAHWNARIRVLRYLKTTPELGLIFTGENEELMVEAYSDSDWGGSRDDRRSTSGIMVMTNGTPVVYKSRLQKSIALSSAEAEYMAMSVCVQEKLWVKQLLREMDQQFNKLIQLFVDNKSAIAIATNDVYQSRATYRHQASFHSPAHQIRNYPIGLHSNETATGQLFDKIDIDKTLRTPH